MNDRLEQFYQRLLDMPFGNRFAKGDLHVHTPASFDFERRSERTVQEVLDAAVAEGLDFVALTDHNSADGYAEVFPEIVAGRWPSLTIFPGVEITVPGGRRGIHLLALFDPGTRAELITDMLTLVGIGHEKRGRQLAIADLTPAKVLEQVEAKGGIAIAAHVNSETGILGGLRTTTMLNPILKSKCLHALEITGAAEADGVRRKVQRPLALIQGSDAHTPEDVGKRFCRIKMDRPSFPGLKAAFAEPALRIGGLDEAHQVVVEGLCIEGGFFSQDEPHLLIRFNESFNCLVGGRGVGKSTVIEAIKSCLTERGSTLDEYEIDRAILYLRMEGKHYALERRRSGRETWKRDNKGGWKQVTLPDRKLGAIYLQGAFYDQAKENSLPKIIDDAAESDGIEEIKSRYADVKRRLLETDRRPYRDRDLIGLIIESERDLAYDLELSEDAYAEARLDSNYIVQLYNRQHDLESLGLPTDALKSVMNQVYGLVEDELERRGGYSDRLLEISTELYIDFLQSVGAYEMLRGLGAIRAHIELQDAPLLGESVLARISAGVLELLALDEELRTLRQRAVERINDLCGGALVIKHQFRELSGSYHDLLQMAGLDDVTATQIQRARNPRALMRALIERKGIPRAISSRARELLLRLVTTHGLSEWLACWKSEPLVRLRGMRDFQPLSRLSIGQQCTVMLNLALVSGDTSLPLIIDQPEDHLDNVSVNESLVSTVKRARQQRQIIFATHNANLAVLGDTDLFSILGHGEYGGLLIRSGSLDDPEVRSLVVQVLEGGEAALRGRLAKYGD